MNENTGLMSQLIVPIIITVLIILGVSYAYLLSGNASVMARGNMGKFDGEIFEGIQFKAAYSPEGNLKVFALASYNALAKYGTAEGKPIPEPGTIVVGYEEARMMRAEDLFNNVGDTLTGLFGINVRVGGILSKTDSAVDDFHFVGKEEFERLEAEDNRIFVRLTPGGLPKLFYYYFPGSELPMRVELSEGNLDDYYVRTIEGKSYYPVLLGSAEAKMMREEKLFSEPGDKIEDFFGKNIIIVGVIKESGSALDMMHVSPLSSSQI